MSFSLFVSAPSASVPVCLSSLLFRRLFPCGGSVLRVVSPSIAWSRSVNETFVDSIVLQIHFPNPFFAHSIPPPSWPVSLLVLFFPRRAFFSQLLQGSQSPATGSHFFRHFFAPMTRSLGLRVDGFHLQLPLSLFHPAPRLDERTTSLPFFRGLPPHRPVALGKCSTITVFLFPFFLRFLLEEALQAVRGPPISIHSHLPRWFPLPSFSTDCSPPGIRDIRRVILSWSVRS